MVRKLTSAARWALLLLLSTSILPACGGVGNGGGTTGSNGLLWNTTSAGMAPSGTPGGGGLLWVDPNSGLGGGIMTGGIRSVDSITYSSPVVYIADNMHPLSTSTTDQTVNQAENGLMQAINGYRSRVLGGIGAGGGVGGGLGGGGLVLPGGNVFLQGHDGLVQNARANCKHYALFHPGAMGGTNPEGDSVNAGGVAPAGRLAKTGIRAGTAIEYVVSGPEFPDFTSVAGELTSNFGEVIAGDRWTHLGAGYWRGGSQEHYWSLILAQNPKP